MGARALLPLDDAIPQYCEIPRCPWHFQAYMLPQQFFPTVAEKGFGPPQLVSGGDVLSTLHEILHPFFCVLLNLLDFITLASMDMRQVIT